MKLRIARSLWGLVRGDGGSLGAGEAVERLAATGAEAVECSLALAHALGARELRDALRANGLAWVPICFSSGPLGDQDVFLEGSPRANHWSDLRSHRDALASNVASALDMASSGSIEVPHVNVHLGHDSMTHSEGVELLGASCDLSERAGVRFAHETHRQRLTYSPWRTPMLLRAEPRARLLGDFAHWVLVAEAEPGDPLLDAAVKEVLPKVIATHGRVASSQAAQVPHPAAPECARETATQTGWIEAAWRAQADAQSQPESQDAAAHLESVWFTPEFGPAPYMPRLPFTGAPVADLEAVNQWMANWAAEAFAETEAQRAAESDKERQGVSTVWRPIRP